VPVEFFVQPDRFEAHEHRNKSQIDETDDLPGNDNVKQHDYVCHGLQEG
jgi:hypothetical protein